MWVGSALIIFVGLVMVYAAIWMAGVWISGALEKLALAVSAANRRS